MRQFRWALAVALVATASLAAPALAPAEHSLLERLSTGPLGGNGNFNSYFRGASADGGRVYFVTAEQLVAADTDGGASIYERSGGVTQLVVGGLTETGFAMNDRIVPETAFLSSI